MPKSVTQLFNIPKGQFDATGAFDSVLDVDARLFVDPFLLPHSSTPEFQDGRKKVLKYFEDILTLIAESNSPNDRTLVAAKRKLNFPEVKGFSLGYGKPGSHGSGMGRGFQNQLFDTACEVVRKGIRNPIVFELVGIFEEDIGCDRISDMVCRILYEDFLSYTSRIFSALKIKGQTFEQGDQKYTIPANPYRSGHPIILIPKDILRDLPMADSWGNISYVCATNQALRQKINELIGHDWHEKTRDYKKSDLKNFLFRNPDFFKEIISEYNKSNPTKYDYDKDPSGEANWLRIAEEATSQSPLRLEAIPNNATLGDLERIVSAICEKFKHLVENNLWKFLYKDNGRPKHESASQIIFYAVADIYCTANKLTLARECNAGRGPVDFKVANGTHNILVDTKLSTNTRLIHAYEKQLPIYEQAENSAGSKIIVIQVNEKTKQIKALQTRKESDSTAGKKTPTILVVDGLPKESASRD